MLAGLRALTGLDAGRAEEGTELNIATLATMSGICSGVALP